VIVDRHSAAEPNIWNVARGQIRQAARARHAFQSGEQPQREQDARVDGVSPDMPIDRLNLGIQLAQIEGLDILPHNPHAMLAIKPLIQRKELHLDLMAFRLFRSRLAPLGV
jgi:hypothetical protein